MTPDAYLASGKAVPTATFSILAEDYAAALNDSYKYDEDGVAHKVHEKNVSQHLVIRFYRYSDMEALVTVEALEQDEKGNWVSPDSTPLGRFFVSATMLDKLEADAERLLKGEYINSEAAH